ATSSKSFGQGSWSRGRRPSSAVCASRAVRLEPRARFGEAERWRIASSPGTCRFAMHAHRRRRRRNGLRLLEEYRAALGAAELRVTASALGVELAEHGLR